MKISVRPNVLALAGVLVLVGAPSAGAADPTYPTGTFAAGPSSQMLTSIPGITPYAYVDIAAMSLADDNTPPGSITSTLDAGENADGVAPKRVGRIGSSASWFVEYQAAGTYTPKVTLKDGDGNTTVITMDPVTVTRDSTPPRVRLRAPARTLRDAVRGWTTLRGTASDLQRRIWDVTAVVMQRRAGVWFVYDPNRRRWIKGSANEAATLAAIGSQHRFSTRDVVEGTWAMAPIRGLTRGLLVVRARASDEGGSVADAPVLRSQIRRS